MKFPRSLFATSLFCLIALAMGTAQVKTETSTRKGQPTVQTTVERGEVISVSGNNLVVKMENGTIRNFMDVPESARVTVDGQQLSIHDLKPGMKLQRTITTTNTPMVVTQIRSVKGKVWQVMPPKTVVLTLEDGSHQKFQVPQGQKFMVNGQETDVFGLKKGMDISATKIVEIPANVATQRKTVTGEMPTPPAATPIQGPVLIVVAPKQPAQVVAQAKSPEPQQQAKKLPQTASELPVMGLIGTILLFSGVVFLFYSRRHARYLR